MKPLSRYDKIFLIGHFVDTVFYKIRLQLFVTPILVLFPLSSFADLLPGQGASVVVRTAKLRSSASHWSKVVSDLPYGEQVRYLSQQGEWGEVESANSVKGFIHLSALTSRKVVLTSGALTGDQGGSVATDVVLAGKGFNADVEGLYKEQVGDLDMVAIDEWEKEAIGDEELTAFLREGALLK